MQEETPLVNSLIPPQVFNARSRQIARPPDHAMHHISLLQTKLRTILAGDQRDLVLRQEELRSLH